MRSARPILALVAMVACHGDDSGAPATEDPRCAFSFAILTDTHIGEGVQDYGTPGWDDSWSEDTESDSEAVLAQAVADINLLAEEPDGPSFVVVLGDITDSGERSELERALYLLNELEIPYLPLVGNHDVWPYAYDEAAGLHAEADTPVGDRWLYYVFFEAFDDAHELVGAIHNSPPVKHLSIDAKTHFLDYAFTYCGVRFVALDTSTRAHAGGGEPGIGPEAKLYQKPDSPWPWLIEELGTGWGAEDDDVVILAHHPFTQGSLLAFDEEDFATIEADLGQHGLEDRVMAFFGGHQHVDAELEGPTGIPVVLTAATKDGRDPRVVRVSKQGELDWDE